MALIYDPLEDITRPAITKNRYNDTTTWKHTSKYANTLTNASYTIMLNETVSQADQTLEDYLKSLQHWSMASVITILFQIAAACYAMGNMR